MKLELASIRTDGGAQPRARVCLETVSEYASEMKSGTKFPPVTVFYDGSDYWLADGFHRRDAAIACGFKSIEADIRQGTQRDAILFSAGANATHGMRRTNDDKRRAVLKLLEDDKWSRWSDREIARRCGVSFALVADLRPHLQEVADTPEPVRTVQRNGTTYQQNTANIGRREVPPPLPVRAAEEREKVIENAPANHVEAKRRAAYGATELFLTSVDGESRQGEIKNFHEWLNNFSEEE